MNTLSHPIEPQLTKIHKKDKQIKIPPRHIVYCVLIRMRKTKKEILSIFDISDGACRAMRSRVRASLGIEDEDMETFLQELH